MPPKAHKTELKTTVLALKKRPLTSQNHIIYDEKAYVFSYFVNILYQRNAFYIQCISILP